VDVGLRGKISNNQLAAYSAYARIPEHGYRLQRGRPTPKNGKQTKEYEEEQRHIPIDVVNSARPITSFTEKARYERYKS
jgi:hypothetical protein